MKMLLRRSQRRTAVMGKAVFILDVRADLTPEEKKAVTDYVPSETRLYEQINQDAIRPGIANMFTPYITTISVSDLASGKRIECKDIVEMLNAEEAIKSAAQTFVRILKAAAHFGGEEVLSL